MNKSCLINFSNSRFVEATMSTTGRTRVIPQRLLSPNPPRSDAIQALDKRVDAIEREDALREEMTVACAVLARRARLTAGLTQTELADKLGVSQARIAQLERAKATTSGPEVLTLARVAFACGYRLKLELTDL